jgi:hypothetical protein
VGLPVQDLGFSALGFCSGGLKSRVFGLGVGVFGLGVRGFLAWVSGGFWFGCQGVFGLGVRGFRFECERVFCLGVRGFSPQPRRRWIAGSAETSTPAAQAHRKSWPGTPP